MELKVDGTGKSTIRTGVAFLDHMLRHYEIPRPATREEALSDDPL